MREELFFQNASFRILIEGGEAFYCRGSAEREMIEEVTHIALLPLLERHVPDSVTRLDAAHQGLQKRLYRKALLGALEIATDYWLEAAVDTMIWLTPKLTEEASFYFALSLRITLLTREEQRARHAKLASLSQALSPHLSLETFRKMLTRHVDAGVLALH